MENQMEILLEKIKEQMTVQTMEITESVTASVMEHLDEKIGTILEENKNLKSKIQTMETKIENLEDEKRKNNLVFYGVKEEEVRGSLINYIIPIIENETTVSIQPQDINNIYRLGVKGKEPRPLLVCFTTMWRRNLILRNKVKNGSGINIKEDFSKKVMEKRRELIPDLLAERAKGRIAYIKKDKLVVKDHKEDNKVKRKRDQVESPITSPNDPSTSIPKKPNKTNIFDYITRSKQTVHSESKN